MAIELKKGQKINLEKPKGEDLGEICINLNWNQKTKKGLFAKSKVIDLDLGCLFELKDGRKGSVQALGRAFGTLNYAPYIMLDGDDRTGENATGENLRINGVKISEIKRILIYTFIYEGSADWKETKGVITIKMPDRDNVIVKMDEYGSLERMCAIAMLENTDDENITVEKIVDFYQGHPSMDKAFDWGLEWKAGEK